MSIRGHLSIDEVRLPPSTEWMDSSAGWRFVRVSQGAAYWMGPGFTKELEPGDVIVAAPSAQGLIRSSQLGEVRLHAFHFSPELFSGFFTLSERHFFETVAVRTKPPVQVVPAARPLAVQFTSLVQAAPTTTGLFQRCKVLDLLAAFFGEDLQRHRLPAGRAGTALKRFKQLIENMTDQEMINYTPRQLAELCGCSLRHFTRLFRSHLGASPCARQIDLRLVKARELLASTDYKIITIAIESGFRNLGVFNALFKKRVGLTPSEWREKHLKRLSNGGRAALLLAACLALGAALVGTTGSGAGGHGDEPPAAPSAAATNAPPGGPPAAQTKPEETRQERLQRIEREVEEWRRSQKGTNAPSETNTAPAVVGTTGTNAASAQERLQRIEREVEEWRRSQQGTNAPAVTKEAPAAAGTVRTNAASPPPGVSAAARTNAVPGVLVLGDGGTNQSAQASTPSTNAGPIYTVRGYDVRGNTLLSSSVLSNALSRHTGQSSVLSNVFPIIRAGLADLQMAYRDRGYVTVKVGLPPQELTNGIVRVDVTEGRLVEITVVNNRYFTSNNIMRALPSLRTNTLLNSLVFQQELNRANANRDRQIYPVVGPGPEPGTSSLSLQVKDRLPVHARMDLNNDGPPPTPELRLNFAAQYNNLWQLDHQFGLQYSFSPTAMKNLYGVPPQVVPPSEGPIGPSDPYIKPGIPFPDQGFLDQPQVASYSVNYRMPLSGVNGQPRPADYTVADFGYDEVTHRFRAPPATDTSELLVYASHSSSDTGQQVQSLVNDPAVVPPGGGLQVSREILLQTLTQNDDIGLRFYQPLSLGGLHSSFSAGFDFKQYWAQSVQQLQAGSSYYVPLYTNDQGQIVYTNFPGFTNSTYQNTTKSLTYMPFAINWEGSVADPYGSTSLSLNNSFHLTGWLTDSADFENVAGSTKATGNYYILIGSLTREQKVYGDWSVRLHADGQWATQPLISNEQYGIGGAPGVRGYLDGEFYGDTGWRVQFQPQTPYYNLGMVFDTAPFLVRLSAFVDYGQAFLLSPGLQPSPVTMFGTGGAVTASIGQHVDFLVTLGVPLASVPGRKAGDIRITFNLGVQW